MSEGLKIGIGVAIVGVVGLYLYSQSQTAAGIAPPLTSSPLATSPGTAISTSQVATVARAAPAAGAGTRTTVKGAALATLGGPAAVLLTSSGRAAIGNTATSIAKKVWSFF